jgi:hypothetical protein
VGLTGTHIPLFPWKLDGGCLVKRLLDMGDEVGNFQEDAKMDLCSPFGYKCSCDGIIGLLLAVWRMGCR